MDMASGEFIKTLILRHRSVAVLIRRGHLDDARLLLSRLVEDVRGIGALPEDVRSHPAFASDAGVLDARITPGTFDPQTIRSLKDVNSLCLKAVMALASSRAKPAGNRRKALALASVAIILAGAMWGGAHFIEAGKREKAFKDMQFMSQVITIAKHKANKTLEELTGNSCSECPCRGGKDLRGVASGDVCQGNWIKSFAICWEAASGESPYDVYGGIILERRFLRDPWGAPYALDENAQRLRSAGPDGVLDTPDDIAVAIQTLAR